MNKIELSVNKMFVHAIRQDKPGDNHGFDTTELYLNLIQVHCLYRVYLQDLKSGSRAKKKNRKGKKKTKNKH